MSDLLKFRNKTVVPPGGYAYQDPDTEHVNIAGTFDQLVHIAKLHRTSNDLEIEENFADVIEDWICRQIPVDMTSDYKKEKHNHPTILTSSSVNAATTQVLHAWRDNKRGTVRSKVAFTRALICSDCSKNTFSSSCYSCRGLLGWIKEWLGKSTPTDSALYVCDICAILNVAQVHMPDAVIKKITPKSMIPKFPEKCWKNKILENQND